jgi:hypothetical protein
MTKYKIHRRHHCLHQPNLSEIDLKEESADRPLTDWSVRGFFFRTAQKINLP